MLSLVLSTGLLPLARHYSSRLSLLIIIRGDDCCLILNKVEKRLDSGGVVTLRYPPRVSYGFGVSATNELLRDISGYLQEQLWGRKASDDFGSPYPRGKVLTAGINLSVLEI
jgi:hypothetical protein